MDNPYKTPEEENLEQNYILSQEASDDASEDIQTDFSQTSLNEFINQTPTVNDIPDHSSDSKKKRKKKEYVPLSPEDNKRANILCVISLACQILPMLVQDYLVKLVKQLQEISITQYANATSLTSFSSSLMVLSMIAGFVLMIYVRVKYPQNTFGKVLMFLNIAFIVIMLIVLAIVLVTCSMICGGILNGAGSSCG